MDRNKFKSEVEKLFEHINSKDDLEYVLNELSNTCHGIAEHLATNWQDENGAKVWDIYGNKIDNLDLSW